MPQKLSVKNPVTGKEFDYELVRDEIRVGRAKDLNDLVLEDDRISRRHAVLRRSEKTYLLIDLKSVNGTVVNGGKIRERTLVSNDVIEIGGYVLVYDQDSPHYSIRHGAGQSDRSYAGARPDGVEPSPD